MPPAFSLRIFLPAGDTEDVRIVEKSNWTGQALVFPRVLFQDVKQRPELDRTGVYVVLGPEEGGRLPKVYVGEGDSVLTRLQQHAKTKDFWTEAVVFTSKDGSPDKAHVKYLEARLVERAQAAKRCDLENGNVPQLPSLSEADQADAEGFLADLLLCVPLVGAPFFELPRARGPAGVELFLEANGIRARSYESPEGFVVLAGSQATQAETPLVPQNVANLRAALREKGVLVPEGSIDRMTQDYVFGSPSLASGVLLGSSPNGREAWRDHAGRTLKELQDAASARRPGHGRTRWEIQLCHLPGPLAAIPARSR